MATYTPKRLLGPTRLSTTPTDNSYSPSASNVGIVRTVQAECPNSSHSFTLSIGTDGATTRLFEAYPLTANVAAIFNLWHVIANGETMYAKADAATQVVLTVSGLEYTP